MQNFQYKNSNAVNDSGKKYTLCRIIPVGVDIKSKKNGICKEWQRSDGGNFFIVSNKIVKEVTNRIGVILYKVNDGKTNNGTQQSQHESKFQVVFLK